ncbi:tRNA (adenosine(37)-N6)-threonylcarbamoyltransferase complex dimerization subunit type 1 TsaB [Desulfosarcina alkanivorans]|uniref:tRNA (Adenosine(37)-N6)-threonylcarbamoyltransferase complex dimerization subunit type 1 TsaB n=1 Tax=Desulfosarcina alkanivorans TaxID=571177 RepID=A0A5K7YB21_9BACT|nr:tRNA (adenosine(37)-N6)-threonylcarbamoyltransferase complex dimerization subunit type 1 TsaB [Desulfosarcina alkanivorans]BBO66592.1 tRNA (adenosine(37)-N6)-threonylcarbamoyltransferase complex dimerization subunit type 1 TsaB [Desulfosarcina alkanivorans]
MILLAIDTSTTSCSVALFSGDRLLAESVFTAGKTHSRHLLSMVDRILHEGGCRVSDVDGIAVTRGPGTFTGLRIGLGTVKGLAAATRAPVVGVSSLAALAFPLRLVDGPVIAMIDARRGEIYHACYDGGTGKARPAAPAISVCAPETAAAALPDNAVLVGSGAALYRDVFESRCPRIRFADPAQHIIRAASVGFLAMARFNEQDVDAIEALVPDYIRKSDAQIQMPSPV